MVLYLADFDPVAAQLRVCHDQDPVLLLGPRFLLDIRIKLVFPSFSDLLANAFVCARKSANATRALFYSHI